MFALQAEIYEHEGNDQQTYLLLFRHAQLVLGHLSNHPDLQSGENRTALALAEKEVAKSLAKLEVLKPRINKRYERYEQLMKDRQARQTAEAAKRAATSSSGPGIPDVDSHRRMSSDPALAGATETLAAGENRELAVRLAHKEIRRRAVARKATRQAGISDEVEQERRAAGLWGNWEEAFAKDDQSQDSESLSQQMRHIRLQVDGNRNTRLNNGISRPMSQGHHSTYNYPSVPERSGYNSWNSDSKASSSSYTSSGGSFPPPSTPPKPPPKGNDRSSHKGSPPSPDKSFLLDDGYSSRSETSSPPPRPDLKSSAFTFQPSAYLENGSPLRTIFLPPDLRHRFLSLALPNTRANLETCGILCGTLISNALFISKLVIPDQESTSDTCETVNESGLFDYVDGEDLMVLGWIHTHPTQTCFMSSRDLHTHCGYQVMMPESIAIVCAPSKDRSVENTCDIAIAVIANGSCRWGVFRLTDPPGMKSILNCNQTGLFHPHAEEDIYTDALRPGHVFEAKGLEFEVVDLRPNRL